MPPYNVNCKISGLTPLQVSLLEQAGCRVTDDKVEFEIDRDSNESSDAFRNRCSRWINRELYRLNAFTEILLKATDIAISPNPGDVTVNIPALLSHYHQHPPAHLGWSDKSLEFIVYAWSVASHTQDVVLCFVMLDLICEAAGVNQDNWNMDGFPPRFAEIKLIRNLLVHGDENPNHKLNKYLKLYADPIDANRFTNRHQHLELARLRCPYLKLAVWNVVMMKSVESEVDIKSDEVADRKVLHLERGPFPVE